MRTTDTNFFDILQVVGLALFLAVTVAQTVRLRVRKRINPITLNIGRKGKLGIMELGLFVLVNIWIGIVLLHVLPLDPRPLPWLFAVQLTDSLAVSVAGASMIVSAFIINLLALAALGDSWRLGIDADTPGPLVTHSIYAISRNPIYVFFDLYFIGTFLANGALIFLVLALLVAANLHVQILEEEKFLIQIHGPVYENYRARVGRYVSLRWATAAGRAWTGEQASD